jgi:electron transfer flavoprotein beta subunit
VRIAVCVAAVPHPDKVKWDRFRQLLDVQDAEMVLNPADRVALELAARLAKASETTFDAYSAGLGASSALREAAAFGAARLVAITDPLLEQADEAGIAAALAAALQKDGADVVFCGAATASLGTGAVPGYLSAFLSAGLLCEAVEVGAAGDALDATCIRDDELVRSSAPAPVVIAAAAYGISVRTVSPILVMRASKKPIEEVSLVDVSDGRINSTAPLPTTGASDGPLESNRRKRSNEIVDGPDAAARAMTLVAALRERQLV